jgi:GT2 family glycosyltransferase/2-polyprenyl-3-methyl-5-hydroxy-6-metoxy-1,4-benzoquinol methylase
MIDPKAADLAVIVPTRDRGPVLARTLDALRRQTVNGFQTLVVVDGADQLLSQSGEAEVLVQDHRGPGAARNTGVKATNRPIVLFLGDDMVPGPDLVRAHLDGHRRHPAVEHAVLGTVNWHEEVHRNAVVKWLESSGTQFEYEKIVGDDAGWGRFYSCNVSLKREFFLSVGGFDEDFEFDYEDLDLGFRLNEKGMVLWYEPRAAAKHLHPYTFEALARRYESRAPAERLMARKHPWFDPYFAQKVRAAAQRPRVSAGWLLASKACGTRRGGITEHVASRVDTWFHQRLSPRFEAAWEAQDELSDLRAYLGDSFDFRLLHDHQRKLDEEEHRATSESAFYRTSQMYLYDLTAFAMMGVKQRYLAALESVIPPGSKVLDYGCGIGSDGIRLAERGYCVTFADFDNPSTSYLRWRLEKRKSDAPVYDVEQFVPSGFDAAYAFDVIEHTDDPYGFLSELESRADIVAVNFLEHDPSDTHLHRPLPIRDLLHRSTRMGLLHYRKYHTNSHFVIYSTSGRHPARSTYERVTGEIERRTAPWRARARQALTS